MNATEKKAVGGAIATLMTLAKHSLSPTQSQMASRSASELLWLLGVEEYEYAGMTFLAVKPRGQIVDAEIGIRALLPSGKPR